MTQFAPPTKPATTAGDDAVPLVPAAAAATTDGNAAEEVARGSTTIVEGVVVRAVVGCSYGGDEDGTKLRVMREVDAAWMERYGHTGAWRPGGGAELLGAPNSKGLVSAHEAATPFLAEARLGDKLAGAAAGEAFLAAHSCCSPYTIQVCVDKKVGATAGAPVMATAKAAGAETGHERSGRRGGGNLTAAGVVGILAASSALTVIAGHGSVVIPAAVAFGSLAVFIAGLSLAVASVRGA